jgi:SecD/SecF fusion protein
MTYLLIGEAVALLLLYIAFRRRPRIFLCTAPVLLAAAVVGRAAYQYEHGQGGFRLGVDLVGGSILVYEVDSSKPGAQDVKGEELAAALKKRIDPADLYNITIRPVPGNPPRVEIILPTGGHHQQQAEAQAWHKLLDEAAQRWPAPDQSGNAYAAIGVGQKDALVQAIVDNTKDADRKQVEDWVAEHYRAETGTRRTLSSEDIERIRNLIRQQGRLEFRILANTTDDAAAIQRAQDWFQKPDKDLADLERNGQPPPPPRTVDGSLTFPVTLQGETHNYSYSWVEVGKEELDNLHLNNAAGTEQAKKLHPDWYARWEEVAKARDKAPIIYPGGDFLIYSRTISRYSHENRLLPSDERGGKKYEYFILTRNPLPNREVGGEFLAGVRRGPDNKGEWAVHFTFDAEGADRFYELTSLNRPSGSGQQSGFKRRLAIVLDGLIRSAPSIESPIRSQGQISGGFTAETVDELVGILRAGALPATLRPDPVSENTMGATLGEDTIRKGTQAVGLAFLAVLVFMLIYYRFAGMVACIALVANLLLTVAFMVLVNATFTLPGLAGLVLTLGMAVDANVLIYERLREERERGASLSLAIRNGYDRAFPTIIDTHLTSIFTAIVLYVVGNDQLKGFGISLTVGLIISLFTSLYMTRTMFDLWQAKNWLKKLSMMQLFHRPNIDFMGIRYYWFTATVILTILGAGLFVWRLPSASAEARTQESSILNIDFIGGTAYTGRLVKPATIDDLRNALRECGLPDLSIEQVFTSEDSGNGSRMFTVRTAERDFPTVQKAIYTHLKDFADANGEHNGLEMVTLSHYEISPDNQWADLQFTKPGTKQPDYASKEQVALLLRQEGLRDFKVVAGERYQLSEAALDNLRKEGVPEAAVKKLQPLVGKVFKTADDFQKALEGALGKDQVQEYRSKIDRQAAQSVEKGGRYSLLRVMQTGPNPVSRSELAAILEKARQAFDSSPQPERLENFDRQLAANTQQVALYAILASWVAILLYLWFRFGNWTFGAATVLCLIHDLFFTLGAIAVCHYLHGTWFGNLVALGDFKIDLPAVAALLTLVGYSVSDTIVVFDRIREVRGKNPALTPQMINDSVNQTLSRTILSSLTVWLVVIVLYIRGGEGVHLFAFVMIVGVVVGTYSSIYIASPLLLIFGEGTSKRAERARLQAAPAQA